MDTKVLEAQFRTKTDKPARAEVRNAGRVPGIFYSRHDAPIPFSVAENAIKPLVFTAETHIVNLCFDNQTQYDCVIKDVQFHPVTDKIVHFDLQGLSKDEKVSIEVPVVLAGSAIGVRDGGQLQLMLHKLHIECLPTDIPESIHLDISDLKLGKSILISDLKYDKLTFLHAEDALVVTVAIPRGSELDADGNVVAEPEVIGKGKEKSEK